MIKYIIHVKSGDPEVSRKIHQKIEDILQNEPDHDIIIGSDNIVIYPYNTETDEIEVNNMEDIHRYFEYLKNNKKKGEDLK